MVGYPQAIDGANKAFRNHGLVLKVIEGLQNYLSSKVKFSSDKKESLVRLAPLNQSFREEIWQSS